MFAVIFVLLIGVGLIAGWIVMLATGFTQELTGPVWVMPVMGVLLMVPSIAIIFGAIRAKIVLRRGTDGVAILLHIKKYIPVRGGGSGGDGYSNSPAPNRTPPHMQKSRYVFTIVYQTANSQIRTESKTYGLFTRQTFERIEPMRTVPIKQLGKHAEVDIPALKLLIETQDEPVHQISSTDIFNHARHSIMRLRLPIEQERLLNQYRRHMSEADAAHMESIIRT